MIDKIIIELKKLSNPKYLKGMERFGLNTENALGVRIWDLRKLGKKIGTNHNLALRLWDSDISEAQMLASIIDDEALVTELQMEKWVNDFNSWGTCDIVCTNLFDKTKFAYKKVEEWTKRDEEFIKRAGFVLMAGLAVHDKKALDDKFVRFFDIIIKESTDERNFVKKAVNWALRQIGKSRNKKLNKLAIKTASEILKIDSKSAKWIAKDALRELKSESVQKRFKI